MARILSLAFFLFFAMNACRSPNTSLISEEAPLPFTADASLPLFNADFDWLKKDEDGKLFAQREIIYCYSETLREDYKHLRDAFDRSVQRVNTYLRKNELAWKITQYLGECPENENFLSQKNIDPDRTDANRAPQLRVTIDNKMDETLNRNPNAPFFVGRRASYSIDRASIEEAEGLIKTIGKDDARFGMQPADDISAKLLLADFRYERLHHHQYIINAEIAFNGSKKIKWDNSAGTQNMAAFDPDLVAMHMIGHALRLKHEPTAYKDRQLKKVDGDVQLRPCGEKLEDGESSHTVVIKAAAGKTLQTSILGDDSVNAANTAITAGPNDVVESSKPCGIMHPFIRVGNRCANPTENERYNFSEEEKMTIKQTSLIPPT